MFNKNPTNTHNR